MGLLSSCIRKSKDGLCGCFQSVCPLPYRFVFSKPSEFRIAKGIVGCIAGAALGALFHFNIITKLPIPELEQIVFGAIVTGLVSLGVGLSVQVRCIIALVLPHFFGKHGRGVVTSIAMMYVLSGPVENILLNAQESARSITCTASLTLNHSLEIFELIHKPFTETFSDLGAQNSDVKKLVEKVKDEFKRIRNEVEGGKRRKREASGQYISNQYKNKLEFECDDIFVEAKRRCLTAMRDMWQKCMDAIRIPLVKRILCVVFKFEIVCNLVKLLDGACDSSELDMSAISREYFLAKRSMADIDEQLNIDMHWEIRRPDLPAFLKTLNIREVQESIKYEVNRRKVWFDFALKLIKTLMSFTFLLVFTSAYKYNNLFLTDLRFDNVYMTSYFRKIDARRKERGKKTLLPLKKKEKKELIDALVLKLNPDEKNKFVKGTLRLSSQVLVTMILLMFDSFFYETLDLIQRHSHVKFNIQGEHSFRVKVHGDGTVARLFQRVFRSMDNQHEFNRISTNKHCLPRPSKLDVKVTLTICGLWILVWFLLYSQSFGLRLRRVFCAFFYRRREKKRILFLYNDYLKKRMGYLRHMRKRVRRLVLQDRLMDEISVLSILRAKYPRICGWMTIFKLGRKKCLICQEAESKKSHHCRSCYFMFCQDCWSDMKEQCLVCGDGNQSEDDGNASEPSDWEHKTDADNI